MYENPVEKSHKHDDGDSLQTLQIYCERKFGFEDEANLGEGGERNQSND
jgi:hypothetical protein